MAKSPRKKKNTRPKSRSSRSFPTSDSVSVLFRPERQRYVRKMIRPSGCVFCAALDAGQSSESLLLHSDHSAMVVMNKYPYNTGHLLVLPRRHCGDLVSLNVNENHGLADCLQQTVAILQKAYEPGGMNVGLNLGAVAGAGLPDHLHFHIIPRWSGDTNFFPLIAKSKVVIETLEESFLRLRPFFAKLKKQE